MRSKRFRARSGNIAVILFIALGPELRPEVPLSCSAEMYSDTFKVVLTDGLAEDDLDVYHGS